MILKLLAIMVPRLIYYGYAMQLTAKLKAKKNDENYTRPIKERVIRNNNKAEIIPYSSSMIIANVSFSDLSSSNFNKDHLWHMLYHYRNGLPISPLQNP